MSIAYPASMDSSLTCKHCGASIDLQSYAVKLWMPRTLESMQHAWPTLFFLIFLSMFGHSMALFGVRRGFKTILSHRAPSSLNMSSYRAIWTQFRPNFIFVGRKNLRSWSKIRDFPKMQISSSSHSHKYLTYMGR